jgi:hypothetical protein
MNTFKHIRIKLGYPGSADDVYIDVDKWDQETSFFDESVPLQAFVESAKPGEILIVDDRNLLICQRGKDD